MKRANSKGASIEKAINYKAAALYLQLIISSTRQARKAHMEERRACCKIGRKERKQHVEEAKDQLQVWIRNV